MADESPQLICPGRTEFGPGPIGATCFDCAYARWLDSAHGVCRLMEITCSNEMLTCGLFRPKELGDDLRVIDVVQRGGNIKLSKT